MKSLRPMPHVVAVILVNSYHEHVNCQQIFSVEFDIYRIIKLGNEYREGEEDYSFISYRGKRADTEH